MDAFCVRLRDADRSPSILQALKGHKASGKEIYAIQRATAIPSFTCLHKALPKARSAFAPQVEGLA